MHALLFLSLTLLADDTKDAANLQGTWIVESAMVDGKEENDIKGDKMTFKDGKITVKTKEKDEKGTYKIDPSQKPKTIDVKEDGKDKVHQGIYKLEGDRLTICIPEKAGRERPTEFTGKEGSKQMLIELKREKK
jgi:uncharacterized protein (TIGR03067 family)